jgi:hypothetical protein
MLALVKPIVSSPLDAAELTSRPCPHSGLANAKLARPSLAPGPVQANPIPSSTQTAWLSLLQPACVVCGPVRLFFPLLHLSSTSRQLQLQSACQPGLPFLRFTTPSAPSSCSDHSHSFESFAFRLCVLFQFTAFSELGVVSIRALHIAK